MLCSTDNCSSISVRRWVLRSLELQRGKQQLILQTFYLDFHSYRTELTK